MVTIKRRISASGTPPHKKPRNFEDRSLYKDSTKEAKHGIILRDFYPPEMTDERARQYIAGEVERPIETLEHATKQTQPERNQIRVSNAVVH